MICRLFIEDFFIAGCLQVIHRLFSVRKLYLDLSSDYISVFWEKHITDQRTNVPTDQWTNAPTDQTTDRQTDRPSYGDAWTPLKTVFPLSESLMRSTMILTHIHDMRCNRLLQDTIFSIMILCTLFTLLFSIMILCIFVFHEGVVLMSYDDDKLQKRQQPLTSVTTEPWHISPIAVV